MATTTDQPFTAVFDLGGVLIDWNPRHLFRKIFDDATEMEWFLGNVCNSEWNRRQDAGRPFADAIRLAQQAHPRHTDAIAAYFDRWPEMLGAVDDGTLAILRDLRAAERRFFALTNWSSETFPVARRRFEFLDWFHGIVVSGDERVAKPDPAIFELMLERYELEPGRTVFIDDSPANAEAARDVGMIGLHFTDATTLRAELESLGAL